MSQIILDIGSGNTLKTENDAIELIDAVKLIDTGKHEVIFKTQLFRNAPPNIPLDHHIFLVARAYAWTLGYQLTSSVFDKPSLDFLLASDHKLRPLPFVKIACRPDLYWLIGEVPRRIPVYVSWYDEQGGLPVILEARPSDVVMTCVPEYPAPREKYIEHHWHISDHTVGVDMFREYKPKIWEKHLCMRRDPNNPDSGPFALLPSDLEGIL